MTLKDGNSLPKVVRQQWMSEGDSNPGPLDGEYEAYYYAS